MSSEEERIERKLSEIVRIGGYMVTGGALMGFSIGAYMLFNSTLFSLFINVSQYEAMSYFLSVFIPSFVILIALGYLFATTMGLKGASLSKAAPLCMLSLICMVVSTLSMIYFLSLLGSFLVLTAVIQASAKPTFKALSSREALFLVEMGAILVACFSALFLLIWLISKFLQTYGAGLHVATYQFAFALLLVEALSLLMFFTIPLWGSRGTNAGFCGTFGLIVTIASFFFVVQNQYIFFNASVYAGLFMVGLGLTLALVGDLTYVKLFFFEPLSPVELTPSLLYQGRYCPYCGKPRLTSVQTSCHECGRSLMWRPEAPFCSSCGRLVLTNAQTCPHCREDIGNKLVYFHLIDAEERALASKLVEESRKEKSWITKGLLRIARLQPIRQVLWSVNRFSNAVIERLSLTLKEFAFIIILTYLFAFLSFVGYVRVEPSRRIYDTLVFNYGFPLAWLQVTTLSIVYVLDVAILWIPLALDVMLYFLASLALVYGVSRLWR